MKPLKLHALVLCAGGFLASSVFAARLPTVYQNSVRGCTQQDQYAGRCQPNPNNGPAKEACLTWKNEDSYTIECAMVGHARLEELETGFYREVTDSRTIKFFPWQQQKICFNFGKDEYQLWKLQKVGVPTLNCGSIGSNPGQNCNTQNQSGCSRPPVDTQTDCSPFDWSCGT